MTQAVRPDDQKAIEAFVRLVRAAEALEQCVNRSFAASKLTPSQFSTLRALRLEGPLAQKDIATHLLKTGGNITMVIDNLEREGLVVRDRDKDDRRVVHVSLTPKGRNLFDDQYPPHLQRILETMSPLTPEERRTLSALLQKLYPDSVVVGKSEATRETPD